VESLYKVDHGKTIDKKQFLIIHKTLYHMNVSKSNLLWHRDMSTIQPVRTKTDLVLDQDFSNKACRNGLFPRSSYFYSFPNISTKFIAFSWVSRSFLSFLKVLPCLPHRNGCSTSTSVSEGRLVTGKILSVIRWNMQFDIKPTQVYYQ